MRYKILVKLAWWSRFAPTLLLASLLYVSVNFGK
jgi:hypothetical protein